MRTCWCRGETLSLRGTTRHGPESWPVTIACRAAKGFRLECAFAIHTVRPFKSGRVVQELDVSATVPRTHSSARIQPRNSSFVTTKTCRSGVPHCRSWPRSWSSRCRMIVSSLMSTRGSCRLVLLSVGEVGERKRVAARDVHSQARAAVVEGCLWIRPKTCGAMKVEELRDPVSKPWIFAPHALA